MPRPKGSKKEKNQSSSPPPLPSIQLCSTDDLNWIQPSMEARGSRPKKNDINDDGIIPTSSSSEGRVVVNPAVLRYLEQNRSLTTTNRNISMDIHEGKEENWQDSNERCVEMNVCMQDDQLWENWTCSTEFLTSARLAEWILTRQPLVKCQTVS